MTVFSPSRRVAVLTITLIAASSICAQTQTQTEIFSGDDLFDQSNIEKFAQFSADMHAAILFSVGDNATGYAINGVARQLHLLPGNSSCPHPTPALSHDGRTLAYWSAQPSGKCGITLLDIGTGSSRPLPELGVNWSTLSWSPDDSEIAFHHTTFIPTYSASIQAVAVRDGSVRTLVPPGPITLDGTQYSERELGLDNFARIEWSHDSETVVVGFTRYVPHPNSQWYDAKLVGIALANHGVLSSFSTGTFASISPAGDRIAWITLNNKIAAANLDGTDRRVLTGAPRWLGLLPGDLNWPITWSPDGKQILFRNIVSDDCTDDIYLLQVDTGRRRRLLHHSCIAILNWR
jgi:hypothetical protein